MNKKRYFTISLLLTFLILTIIGCDNSTESIKQTQNKTTESTESTELHFVELGLNLTLEAENGELVANDSELSRNKNYYAVCKNLSNEQINVSVMVLIDGMLLDNKMETKVIEGYQKEKFEFNLNFANGKNGTEVHQVSLIALYYSNDQKPKDELDFSNPGYNLLNYTVQLEDKSLIEPTYDTTIHKISDSLADGWTLKLANEPEIERVFRTILNPDPVKWFTSVNSSTLGEYAYYVFGDGTLLKSGFINLEEKGIYEDDLTAFINGNKLIYMFMITPDGEPKMIDSGIYLID